MRKIYYTATARADIESIVSYILADNPAAAYRWAKGLDSELEAILRFPGLGRLRDDIRPGIRSFPFGNYMIYYSASHDGIVVIRVVHGARDIDQLFKGKDDKGT